MSQDPSLRPKESLFLILAIICDFTTRESTPTHTTLRKTLRVLFDPNWQATLTKELGAEAKKDLSSVKSVLELWSKGWDDLRRADTCDARLQRCLQDYAEKEYAATVYQRTSTGTITTVNVTKKGKTYLKRLKKKVDYRSLKTLVQRAIVESYAREVQRRQARFQQNPLD